MIYVCPFDCLEETVSSTRASHVVSILNEAYLVPTPNTVLPEHHLRVDCHDIIEPLEGCVLPSLEHVRTLIAFAEAWPREQAMVVHCFAGVSRSTASAYVAACIHSPPGSEQAVARSLRQASPTATPNGRIVALADALLGRDGRMISAIAEIGRGEECMKGTPFLLAL